MLAVFLLVLKTTQQDVFVLFKGILHVVLLVENENSVFEVTVVEAYGVWVLYLVNAQLKPFQ